MTKEFVGLTKEAAGMTIEFAGMTKEGVGMEIGMVKHVCLSDAAQAFQC